MAHAKRSNQSGKFAPNPNSARQKKLREKAAREAAALSGTVYVPAPSNPVAPTADALRIDEQGDRETTADDGANAVTTDAVEASHVDGWFPDPPKPPLTADSILGTDSTDENDDSDTTDTGSEKPRPNRQKRKRAQMLAQQLVQGCDGTFGLYIKARHAEWIEVVASGLKADGQTGKAAMLEKLSTVSESEQGVLIESVARYIEENNVELSPGAELALLFGSIYGGRIITLEGTLFAINRKAGGL